MFQKDSVNESIDTIIGSSIMVEGNFEGEGNIIIEGAVKGNLKTTQNITAGEGSKIIADIEAVNAIISGEIHGNIRILDKLELTSTAVIIGNVEAGVILVAGGASIDGNCKIGGGVPDTQRQSRVENEEADEYDVEDDE